MKTIKDAADALRRDIIRQSKREALYLKIDAIFNGVEFPDDTYLWICDISSTDSVHVEFSPNGENKDIRQLVHDICQKFNVEFTKERDYDEQGLRYTADFEVDGQKLHVIVSGVVPSTCRIEEKIIELTPEEYMESRERALESVKPTRVERRIICD